MENATTVVGAKEYLAKVRKDKEWREKFIRVWQRPDSTLSTVVAEMSMDNEGQASVVASLLRNNKIEIRKMPRTRKPTVGFDVAELNKLATAAASVKPADAPKGAPAKGPAAPFVNHKR